MAVVRSIKRVKHEVAFDLTWLWIHLRRTLLGAGLPRRWYPKLNLPHAANIMSHSHWTCIEDSLFLGDIHAASSDALFNEQGITHVVNATQEVPNVFETTRPDVAYMKTGWFDDNRQVGDKAGYREAYEFIEDALQSGGRVLVHCQEGFSRSASIVLYYLCKSRQLQIDKALEWLSQHRWTNINETFIDCIAHIQAEDAEDDAYLDYAPNLEVYFALHY